VAMQRNRSVVTLRGSVLSVGAGFCLMFFGYLLPYQSIVKNAANSNARDRVLSAVAMVDDYKDANAGHLPDGPTFLQIWSLRRADDFNVNPWSGQVGAGAPKGAIALPDVEGDAPDATAASQHPSGIPLAIDPTRAAAMIYVRIKPGAHGAWRGIAAGLVGQVVPVKGFVVGIYGPDGQPWWDVKGGQAAGSAP
jgi:hypothetical protein